MALTSFYNKYNLLRQIPLFSGLNWIELHLIAGKVELREYKKKDIIYRKGEPADAFYCLVSGRILAYLVDVQDRKHNIEYIYRG
ncbi:MAG: cyclic nucleotide-binding domain-containing protein, partial [Candidatus Omnitrophica bacterium]|nr:cyclic nucleotide-binding domain-containing protein [Candidatus Omnitrophota bacterium]